MKDIFVRNLKKGHTFWEFDGTNNIENECLEDSKPVRNHKNLNANGWKVKIKNVNGISDKFQSDIFYSLVKLYNLPPNSKVENHYLDGRKTKKVASNGVILEKNV